MKKTIFTLALAIAASGAMAESGAYEHYKAKYEAFKLRMAEKTESYEDAIPTDSKEALIDKYAHFKSKVANTLNDLKNDKE